MLLTLLPFAVGFFVGKGKRGTRMWKMLGIVLGMSFFLSLITIFIPQIYTIILPVGTNEILNLLDANFDLVTYPQLDLMRMIITPIISVILTFFWFLVGRFSKWLISRRGL